MNHFQRAVRPFTAFLELLNFTINQLAQAVGVQVTMVGHWERRQALAPRPVRIHQMCQVLNCQDSELELLELAHRERGRITFDLEELSDAAVKLLTQLEDMARTGKLTPAKSRKLHQSLERTA